MAAGVVVIPWYATGFRGDGLEQALNEIAPVAMRYGATAYAVYRARDDRYKFQQFSTWNDKLDWERYWEGPHMVESAPCTRAGTRSRSCTGGGTRRRAVGSRATPPRWSAAPSRAKALSDW